jgi:hypothetical protein
VGIVAILATDLYVSAFGSTRKSMRLRGSLALISVPLKICKPWAVVENVGFIALEIPRCINSLVVELCLNPAVFTNAQYVKHINAL